MDLDLRIPKEMGGAGGATNPEQLFAAGYAACFHSAIKVVAGRDKLDVTGTEVSASVSIGAIDGGGFGLAVELDVHAPALDQAAAEKLVAAPTRSAPTPTPPAATSTSPSASSDPAAVVLAGRRAMSAARLRR